MVLVPLYVERFEYRLRLPQLPFPAVDKDNVRDFALFNRFTIATAQHLVHGGIIVTGRNAGDVIATILCPQGAIRIKDHTRRHGLLTHRMADVEAFHAFHFRQLEQRSKGG